MDPEGEASYLHSTTFANDIIEICRQVHTACCVLSNLDADAASALRVTLVYFQPM